MRCVTKTEAAAKLPIIIRRARVQASIRTQSDTGLRFTSVAPKVPANNLEGTHSGRSENHR